MAYQIEISRRPYDRHFAVWQRVLKLPLGQDGFVLTGETFSDYWQLIGVTPSRREAQAIAVNRQKEFVQ